MAELEIPVAVLHFLKRKYPDLDSKDSSIKTKAWKKYLACPASAPYRVRGKGRFLARSTGGLEYGWQSGRAKRFAIVGWTEGPVTVAIEAEASAVPADAIDDLQRVAAAVIR